MSVDAIAIFGFGVLIDAENLEAGEYPWSPLPFGGDFDEWAIDKYGFGKELHAQEMAWRSARDVPVTLPEDKSVLKALSILQKDKSISQDAYAIWKNRKKEIVDLIGVSFEYGGEDGWQSGCVVVTASAHRANWSSMVEAPPDTSFSATTEYAQVFQAFAEKTGLVEYDLGELGWLHCVGLL